jgi:hypothetical protein
LRSSFYANELNLWFVAFGAVFLSFIFAIPFTLLFESPFLNIEKYILFPAPHKNKQQEHNINESYKENNAVKDYFLLDEKVTQTSNLLSKK